MRAKHRRVTGETCLGDIRIDAACEVEGLPLGQVIGIVQEMVEARILHWAEGNSLRVLLRTVDGEVIH